MNQLYGKGKEALCGGGIDWVNDDIRALLIDTGEYTPNFSTDDNLDDIAAGGRVGTAVALTGKTNTLGVLDADDVTFTSVTGDSIEAFVLYLHTGTESTSKLLAYFDGKFQVDIAASALSGATSITTEDLPAAIASGGTLTKISGTGPTTITTSASGAEGARALSVTALSSGITAGAIYEYSMEGSGLPFTPPGGGDIKIAWSDGALKILSL
jgi:hypothetical protein